MGTGGKYEDRYRKRLQKIVRDKGNGKTIDVEMDDRSEPDVVPDLMAALQKALEDAKAGGSK